MVIRNGQIMKNEQTAIIKQFSHLGKVNVSIAGAVLSAALFLANPNVKEIKADTVTDKESQVNDHKVIDNHESSQNQNNQVAKVKLIADQITTNSGNKESTAQRLSQTEQSKQQPQLNDKKDHTKISSQSEEPSNNTWNGLKVTYNDQTKALTINKGGSITDPDPIASNIPHYQDIESINIADKIKIWGKANNLFANLPNLKSIKNLDNLDTSQVTHMTGMFANDSSLQSLDLSSLDTSNCGAMDRMFSNDANLTTLALNKFNTSKVKYMQYMFDGDSSLTKLDLSNFKAIETVDSSYMFRNCANLTNLTFEDFGGEKIVYFMHMFDGCTKLSELDLSSFESKVASDTSYMFSGCTNLTNLKTPDINTSQVVYMNSMFKNCGKLEKLDLSTFNTTSALSMSYMFYNDLSLKYLNLSSFSMHQVIYKENMLSGLKDLAVFVLGKDSVISGTGLDTPKDWIRVKGGTIQHPKGTIKISSTNLAANYNGETDADTYVHNNLQSLYKATINYIDLDNNSVLEADKVDIVSGTIIQYKEKYNQIVNSLISKGYVLNSSKSNLPLNNDQNISIPDNVTGDITYTVAFNHREAPKQGKAVTIHYQDTTGNDLIQPIIINGKIGDPYTSQEKKFSDYQLKEVKGNKTGTISDTEQNIYYIYEKITKPAPDPSIPTSSKATINYIDLDNNSVLEADEVDIVPGTIIQYKEKYNQIVNSLISKGYVLNSSKSNLPLNNEQNISIPDNVTGDITYTVAFNHREAPKQGKAVTIHYQDTTGNDLIQPIIINGKIGDPYTSQEKKFSDYQLKEVKGNKTGTISDTAQNIYYIYEKITKPAPNPLQPSHKSPMSPNKSDLNQSSAPENRHSHQTEPSNEQKQLILPNKHRRNLSIWEKREQQQSSEKSKQDLANASNHQLVTIPRLMSNKLTVPPDDKVNKNSMLPQTGSNQKEKNLFTFSGIIALLMTLIGGLGFKRKKKQD
ncbi:MULTISPECIES: MucBP domain-containing protein [unclassified Lactobacillus]|uniref:MucBP domain-containing protein n=2 Tax=Lactobacillus TaxID=1578 RepID=UPI000EFAB220|nr:MULTISPECIES: MucBP domain-containing protein [unclassified Lactobacillus]RMC23469.1 BspA family leucine-rich repeat surface protein [Lactobacillus sp. ESL0247]RMC27266.1 BspA family leucine-rich repeat surface protein [Lactobacillus sp. ESL0246]RMC30332.1 BspA family leucine-rich repeat surface protein [Lactobacillus sp. ESL0245]